MSNCCVCGMSLLSLPASSDRGDGLCQMCFVTYGMEVVVEVLNSQAQRTLFEQLMALSHQAHQREQTDVAYYALSAAYHAAYQPGQVESVIRDATERIGTWRAILDECGTVRIEDYRRLLEEAQEIKRDITVAIHEAEQTEIL